MTGLTAAKFGLAGRGQVQPGCYADLTVFDPARIADAASFERPTERAPASIRCTSTARRSGASMPSPAGIRRVLGRGPEA